MSEIKKYNAPAGANYGSDDSNIGEAVYMSDAEEVTVCTASTQESIGVIVDAEDRVAGWVAVCVDGPCKGRAGAAWTLGTTTMFIMAAADGRLDPYSAVADTAGASQNRIVGRLASRSLNDIADDDIIDIIVSPQAGIDTQT